MKDKIAIFWYRRDLRLYDNKGLSKALQSGYKVLPIFIFDEEILDALPKDDARVNFIYESLKEIDKKLKQYDSSLLVLKGKPLKVWSDLSEEYEIKEVYTNKDYEPYAIQRDTQVQSFLASKEIAFHLCKDQVIFEENEVVKNDGTPYTVYTPYKNKWLKAFSKEKDTQEYEIDFSGFLKKTINFPMLDFIGFKESIIKVKPYDFSQISSYDTTRDFPAKNTTSYISPHLRFGTVSVREMVKKALDLNQVFLSELIWREFFMQILYHFPKVVTQNFKSKYDAVPWRNNKEEFEKWCRGETGYPMVDAGMRELNKTGYMHNRVRMITAGFLCKHLLIDWRWGEAYFAEKLLDYELASNNGNWQWSAGTGCDAAPYFRVFNPTEQLKKFDKDLQYVKTWVKDFEELSYPQPIVEHKFARERAISTYKNAL
ncbi:Deoxyribodipyrimidine photolyase [Tenacibaculum sp. 190130A14a]|uniref:Deoxyribodipyrimidine photo-lyase n=1 Tax=Tenacibaculum polynesiense TaxID=3137857 RepID=A0ABM9PBF3_9FLAO